MSNLKLINMEDVEVEEVKWLIYPFIPYGKITIIQGDPGEGKTTLGLRLAAACSNGTGFPGMEEREPISVISMRSLVSSRHTLMYLLSFLKFLKNLTA